MLHNPASELKIPKKCQPGRAMPTVEEVNEYLEAFDLREKLALRWKGLAGEAVQVEQRIYERVLNTPKDGKPLGGCGFG